MFGHELCWQMDKGKKCISVVGKRVAFGRPFCYNKHELVTNKNVEEKLPSRIGGNEK